MARKSKSPPRAHHHHNDTGYCVKCKANGRPIKDGTKGMTVRGQPMLKGTCGICNGGMCKFLKK